MHDAGTGIQRVVRALLSELQRRNLKQVVVRPIASQGRVSYRYLPPQQSGWPKSSDELAALPEVVVEAGDIFFGLDLAAVSLRLHEGQLALWRAKGASIHILLYDLLPLRWGQFFRRRTRRNFRRWLGVIERQADQVICISKTVAGDFQRWHSRSTLFRRRSIAVTSIGLGADIEASSPSRGLHPETAAILAWLQRSPTVLMVGTVEPRKAYDQALAAFEMLWSASLEDAPQLLLVGRPGWKTGRLQRRLRQRSGLDGHFLWLDTVSDELLALIYQGCSGVLFPSKAEGYGLPVVEALQNGKVVLARDQPVLRELEGPGLSFFSSSKPKELGASISDWLLTAEPIAARPSARSWAESATELLRLLELDCTTA